MALKPNDGETFLKEVDDELRREQITNFFTRYGWWIIGGVVLILASVAGWLWYSGRQVEASGKTGQELITAVGQLQPGTNGFNSVQPQINELVGSDVEGYRAAALFARATGQAQSGNNAAAVATLRSIAEDQTLDQVYRDAALIRRTQLEFDGLQPQEVIRRLNGIATGTGAWAGTAGELVGIAHLKMNRPDLAGPVFVRIAQNDTAPATLRDRAGLMAASLGFDPDRNAPRAAGRAAQTAPAVNAATPAPAPAANAAAPAQAPATREKAR